MLAPDPDKSVNRRSAPKSYKQLDVGEYEN
jgi:hypothetical protein